MATYLQDAVRQLVETPQGEPMRADQVQNAAGGYGWSLSPWGRLTRFLILGSEGGTYYASQRALTAQNVECVRECIAEDGPRAVALIAEISQAGRAPKNDPAILALALCATAEDVATRRAALAAVPTVCRIGTHLFTFCGFLDVLGGWGRAKRRAVGAWYAGRDAEPLAYQMVKYRQRGGWTHRDVLRLAHPDAPTREHRALYDWTCGRADGTRNEATPRMVEGYAKAQAAASSKETGALIRSFGLSREMVQTDHLTDPGVWAALLEAGMPLTALIRNLGTMSKVGLLVPMSAALAAVVARLGDAEGIRLARVHPVAVLAALLTYKGGHGIRGGGEWPVVPQVVDALDGAFYASFGNVEPTGKRIMLALDVSGSMGMGTVAGVPGLTPRVAAACMALITARVEPNYMALAFSDALVPFPLSARQRLDDACAAMDALPFGRTDCALPMVHARADGLAVDAFVILTDNETWSGTPHPAQALASYRRATGIDARLIVVGMTATGFSIADPRDAGMLDVVGFDTATPEIMREFIGS